MSCAAILKDFLTMFEDDQLTHQVNLEDGTPNQFSVCMCACNKTLDRDRHHRSTRHSLSLKNGWKARLSYATV